MSDNMYKTADLVVTEGQTVELEITDMTDDGKGLGRLSGLAIFVAGAVPGDKVSTRITRLKKRYALAETITLLEASAVRVQPPCPYYKDCGGCSMLELSYDEQLRIKRKNIITKLERIGALEDPTVREVVGAVDTIGADGGQAGQIGRPGKSEEFEETGQPEQIESAGGTASEAFDSMLRYRNKAEFAVAMTSAGPLVGFNKRGSNKIVDCTDCLLQKRATMAAANAIRNLLQDKLISVYDVRHGKGFLRGFTIKVCEGTGEMMLIFTGTAKHLPNAEKVIYTISDAIDAVSTEAEPYFLQSVVVEVNKAKDVREPATAYEVVAGSNTVTDITDDGMKFEISAPAFYQVNTKQMSKLYAKVREYACLKGGETIFDLYCGIGTIGLSMATQAGMIIGIESVKNAVIDANRNAVINGIVNARYYTGRAEHVMPRLLDKEDKLFVDYIDENAPKIAILDPPRAGCDEALLRAVASCEVDKIVYVSCNPGTLARDIKLLGELGYEFVEATPVDMFVATMHVECIALIQRVKS
ncbi:MAG: 23S rRNA (uracil(1939)-C(5))-methyltransferase RlmD [Mogibacterium diversum]|jgi:23S rRNA (uracil-5-)-methyltransferase rumA|uniref:23S rRNA (uracil(1939)-C(5))-methyltransferase RlmD n=2 Tax=Anaerovoracaceae TaxID=543314 RepID=UPI00180D4A8D|nr:MULTISPECIES: 23S rRNA (uracil(1939)-C(5))-methyltransferase RlmD [Mogibacterium]MBB1533136.1 23S rRNA (uracil(1939)-C(5))-methyltransferase RlmD [Mogibacterium sp.]MBF1322758.1 23S rRNA (uracil(1939)-C(5))-methyltransferase RlmD [Mogibacterium diversum]MBF1338856.1 23S rRNA (uracil(1939)-C(5))-methyltransferase RlmD [Mogibacterium diversum]MBF1360168.1 23S rRNA (uracil(1939)-C(5))-methyltransferase RlmD [Mogibacterium diversum]UQF81521.1 MAG: 23S rRNA (uracil(1939)-C(5))-methyltransferase 